MKREENPQEWFRLANLDLQMAQNLLEDGIYEGCVFHCQQAVEKLLKAIIVKQTHQRPPHVHDLLTLLRKVAGIPSTEALERSLANIDAYYVGSRYPMDVVDPGVFIRPLAESALQETEVVFQWFSTQSNFKTI